jgi:Uma2 family endonuclease
MADNIPNRRLTVEEYLELEDASEIRHEYVDGHIFAMSGGTNAHEIITGNLFAALHGHLRGTGCRPYIHNMKVYVQVANSFYYPDVMVTCEQQSAESVFSTAPSFIVEVLSPSTKRVDLMEKLVSYRKLPSLKQYLAIHQKSMLIEEWLKVGDEWEHRRLTGFQELTISAFSGAPLVLRVETVYEGLDTPSLVEEEEEEYEVHDYN